MPIELKVPEVGESITEVVIAQWLRKEGESVKQDEPLVVIETDKVTVELPAPVAGKLSKCLKANGSDATVGEVIGYLEAGEVTAGEASDTTPSDEAKPTGEEAAPRTPVPSPETTRVAADASTAAQPTSPSAPKSSVAAPPRATSRVAPRGETTTAGQREEETIRMSPLRRRIAERLVEAQQTAALLTTFNEVDMSGVIEVRTAMKEKFLETHGVKLGFMSFFVKAVVEALKDIPEVNAEVAGDSIVYRNYYDIGVAIGGGKGLVVPILRNAERLSFADIERGIRDFAVRAKENKLEIEELTGGTFTISNGGVYGSLLSTPIVNPPQSGILGLHAIEDRPVARNGEVVIRPMMYVALTYDHRIVDGREAVTFLKRVKEIIEEPTRILLEA